jgi:hypothetical protein
VTAGSLHDRFVLHAMLNAYWEALTFELPLSTEQGTRTWRPWIERISVARGYLCVGRCSYCIWVELYRSAAFHSRPGGNDLIFHFSEGAHDRRLLIEDLL